MSLTLDMNKVPNNHSKKTHANLGSFKKHNQANRKLPFDTMKSSNPHGDSSQQFTYGVCDWDKPVTDNAILIHSLLHGEMRPISAVQALACASHARLFRPLDVNDASAILSKKQVYQTPAPESRPSTRNIH